MSKKLIYVDSTSPGAAVDSGIEVSTTTVTIPYALAAGDVTTDSVTISGNLECDSLTISGVPIGGSTFATMGHRTAGATDGGTAYADAWTTLPITTSYVNNIDGMSLTSNTITFPAGTYKFLIIHNFYSTEGTALRLYNVTDDSVIGQINVGYVTDTTSVSGVYESEFTLADTKDITIEYYCTNEVLTSGLGLQLGTGSYQYHGHYFIERLYIV